MTIAVDMGRKATKTNKQMNNLKDVICGHVRKIIVICSPLSFGQYVYKTCLETV